MPDEFPSPQWLERANRLAIIARLLDATVHDLNNALQVIGGSAELLQMTPSGAEGVLRRSQSIGTQSKRASVVLGELMELVRDRREQAEPVGLKAVAEHALALRQYALSKRRLNPVVEGDEVMAQACPRHVLQIVLNLVMNAEQAAIDDVEGRLLITVRPEGDRALLIVGDNGRGVPATAVPHLFEARFTTEPGAGNLGIGLSVCRWLVERSGGSLNYAPGPAGGSLFTLAIPASGR